MKMTSGKLLGKVKKEEGTFSGRFCNRIVEFLSSMILEGLETFADRILMSGLFLIFLRGRSVIM